MLTELRIANFAVIERLSLEVSNGFHVFTGETGAGKSILVDAIALLVGGRASVDQIRADADEAELEAAFSLSHNGPLLNHLRGCGVLEPQDSELIIRRVVSRSGRNRVYVNGRLTPLHVLQGLAGTLVDIHGQHDQQSLLSVEAQRDALDSFANLKQSRAEYGQLFHQWRSSQRALEDALREAAEGGRHEEYLRFQYRELQDAALQPGEEETLLAERNRLAHAHRLEELGEGAYQALYGGEHSILSSLGVIEGRLRELGSMDPGTAEWGGVCDSTMVQLRELALQVRGYLQGLEQDPSRLASIEERLDRIHRLKRKYGVDIETLLARAEELKAQLERLDTSQSHIDGLRDVVARDYAEVQSAAGQLSQARKRAGADLEAAVKKELAALRMAGTRFQVEVQQDRSEEGLTSNGCDRVEYLLSANAGEPLFPLAKVASGGELSRIMLAIKTVLAKNDRVPVLIFDEIDAGIGGAVAEVMGRRLKGLGAYHQVFCITHLPQIASQADWHFVVEKMAKQKRTVTCVRKLEQQGRREEIARMLGGVNITKAVRETAAEMIGDVKGGE